MASNFSIKLSVSVADLIASIQEAITKDINGKDALKGTPINVYVDNKVLLKSIQDAIASANKDLTNSEGTKLNVGVNQNALIDSIKSSITAFNQNTNAEGKTVKLTADLDITAALKKLQAQLAKNNLVSTNVGTDSTAKTADTEKQKKANTDSLVSSIKQETEARREYEQLTLDSYSKEIESEKQREAAVKSTTAAYNEQNKALEKTNDLLRQQTNYADAAQQNPTTRARTYGSPYLNTTYYDTFDESQRVWESNGSTVVENIERLNKANARAYDTIQQLQVKLNKARTSYADLKDADKPIDKSTDAFKRLEAEGQRIADMFPKISEASGTARDKLVSDAKAAIEQYKISINEQYSATSLRSKSVPKVKEIEANKLDALKSKIAFTHIPAEILASDFQRLATELNNVSDRSSLASFLNNLDIFKSKVDALTVKFKQLNKIRTGLTSDLTSLKDYKSIGQTLIPESGADTPAYVKELNKQMAELYTRITDTANAAQRMKKNIKDTNTVETVNRKAGEQEKLHQETVEIAKSVEVLKKKSEVLARVNNELIKYNATVMGTDSKQPITDKAALNVLRKTYRSIESDIVKASKLDGEAHIQAIANIKSRISSMERLIDTYKEYEYIGGKNIESLRSIAKSDVSNLATNMAGKGLLTGDLAAQLKELKVLSENIVDSNSFVRYKTLFDELTASVRLAVAQMGQLEKYTNNIDGSLGKLNSASGIVNSSKFGASFDEATVSGLNAQITTLTNKLNTLKTAMANAESPETIQKNIEAYNQVEKEVTDVVNAVTQLQSLFTSANTDINKLSNILNPAIFKRNGSNEKVVTLKNQVSELDTKYRQFLEDLGKDVSPEGLKRSAQTLEQIQTRFADLRTHVNGLKNDLQQTNIDQTNLRKYRDLIANIDDYARKNNKAMSKINPNTGLTYGEDFNKIKQAAEAATVPVEQLRNQTAMLQAQIKSAGMEGQTFFSELASKAEKFIKWMGMTFVITKVRMYLQKLFTTVYDLDVKLTDLMKTFEGTTEDLNDFYFAANKLAKQLGVTTASIIEQGSAWSRLGYNTKETMAIMSEMSSILDIISPDMDANAATDGLVSIMKAFDIAPENVLDEIISKVNIIGNTAATSNGEIIEMLKRSSSAMKEGNNTLEETIALETAAVEITRDAASVGMYRANHTAMCA